MNEIMSRLPNWIDEALIVTAANLVYGLAAFVIEKTPTKRDDAVLARVKKFATRGWAVIGLLLGRVGPRLPVK